MAPSRAITSAVLRSRFAGRLPAAWRSCFGGASCYQAEQQLLRAEAGFRCQRCLSSGVRPSIWLCPHLSLPDGAVRPCRWQRQCRDVRQGTGWR